jgi:cystathionine beta-lyase
MAKYDFDEPVQRRGTHCVKWDETEEDGVIQMWVADMDFRTAPAIRQALQRRVEHGVFGYTLVPEAYYDAVISWFGRRHGWQIEREWIQYTTAVVPALSVVIKALCEQGDKVIIQTPVYNCFFSSIRNNGCGILENPLRYEGGKYTIDFDDLERKAADPKAKLLVLCNPHNPVGRLWTKTELERLNDVCRRNGVMVVSDEIHCELTYGEQGYVPFAAVSQACLDNSVICCSPSKSFNTAGLQIANIISNNPTVRRRIDRAININEVCDVNPFGVEGLMAAYNESGEWMDELCRYLKGNYDALCDYFAEHMPELYVLPLEATYLVWVDISKLGIKSDELTARLLSEGKVHVNSGTMYGSEAGEGFIRINIALPRSRMIEGLQRISSVTARL